MTSITLDKDGIPVLENPLDIEALGNTEPSETALPIDLTDHEQLDALLKEEAVQSVLADLTEDLQKLVTWKIEYFLKEELNRLVREAAEQSAPKLTHDIRTQLDLALPDLLAKVAKQAQR